ncbi:extended synaptotagmin-3 isoform X1 [Odontomachus brunneus]|uniref:extended synaptotagmin-3 isoform X1 n=1 Tax=Odontomachus brunneus TaxID=486640 RepID=UPI0013F202C7|nr:extended synaptotagmin-3 isoform X1 [Odontomachus brunneus]XP_032679723.1 extended synaptotagmin-3 isoform X1 [Odontomachus brunneus]XP_032679724.1 extended synaptotagmin-3 isoform X1 [Odontomachus brunneus]
MEDKSENYKVSQPSTWPYMNVSSLTMSFVTKLMAAGIIWGWGYFNFSIAWLIAPIAFSVWKAERKRDNELRTITAQASVLAKEKQLIVSRIDELPSWVYFPDFDRAEWLNRILYKVWPSMNEYVRQLCKQNIEPSIVQTIKGFQFDRLVLGRIPPRIYGIKVYDKNTSRNEIILDADIIYAGDCDITFFVGNIKGGIKDFQMRGLVRVIMKPMLSVMPLVGGIQIFYLNNPTINFNLVGVADVLDLPGFNEILRRTIIEQIAAIAVLPNKIVIPLSEEIPMESLKTPEPEGVLRIHVVEAKHLMKKDIGMLGKGKSDPYAIINVGAEEFRTKTIDNTVNPKWDFWCEAMITSCNMQEAVVSLWDWDPNIPGVQYDDSLGRATIEVIRVKKKGMIDTWISLEQAKHGMVHLRLTWLQLSKDPADLKAALIETQELRVTSMSTALLTLYIDSAKNLPCIRGNKQPDVYLVASVGGKTKKTATMPHSCDPIWERGFTFLISNPETGILNLKLTDEKTGMSVGEMNYNLFLLLEKNNLQVDQQPYDLQMAAADSKLVMSMSLNILKYEQPEPTSEEDEDDHDINQLNKRIERQESNISNILLSSAPSSPLRKQPSKESINSQPRSTGSGAAALPEEAAAVEEELIINTSAPSSLTGSPHLIHRNVSVTSSLGEAKLGRIQLTLRYSVQRQKFVVVVHKIANLPLPPNDPHNIPDPYVKLYLLPDRHKETKRKTAVMKDNCNPTFDEQFEFVVSQGDLGTRTLEVLVCTQKGWLSAGSKVMGQVLLKLSEVDISKAITSWYDLQPEVKD